MDQLDALLAECGSLPTMRFVVRGAPITDPQAVIALSDLAPEVEVRVVMGPRALSFHPKLWIVQAPDAVRVLSGSGNLTAGGLVSNDEQFELLHLALPEESEAAERHWLRWRRFFDLGSALTKATSSPAWGEWIAQGARRRRLDAEVARLDQRLAEARNPPPAGHEPEPEPSEDPASLVSVLQAAAGARYTAKKSKARWGARVQIDLGDGRGLRYVFLMSHGDEERGRFVSVDAQPGDTLTQARVLYGHLDDHGRDALLELGSTPGWSVAPAFHLGTPRSATWLEVETPGGLARYLDFWRTHIGEYGQRPAEEWPAILKRLAAEQIVPESYPERYRSQVGDRPDVHPRPGLQINRYWSAPDARQLELEGRLADEVRHAVNRMLAAIGETPIGG
ncbi:MAG: hypothetical protein ACXVSL_12290 [Solirubrobacteraceae bacterium]